MKSPLAPTGTTRLLERLSPLIADELLNESLKAGHTRFFVGYKKHTLRLWLRAYEPAVRLVPLVSWTAPAHVPEGYLLKPSLHDCGQRLRWQPAIVPGDLGDIHQATKREIPERWQVAVVTELKSDMRIAPPGRPMRGGYSRNEKALAKANASFLLQKSNPLSHLQFFAQLPKGARSKGKQQQRAGDQCARLRHGGDGVVN